MSEHKCAGYSIDWANVEIIGQENHLLSHKILVAIAPFILGNWQ